MIAIANNQLGWLLSLRGGLSEAERFFRTAIEEYRKLPAGVTYVTLGDSLRNLGTVLLRRGRYAEAEPLIGESLEMNRRLLGSAHFATANSLAALADLLYLQGQYRAAEADAREALKALTQALPKGNIALAIPLTELGLILNKTSRSHEGERDLREALDIRTSRLPAGHQLIAVTEGALGECLTTQKRYADAEPLLLSSYAAMKFNVGEQDPRTAEARERLVTLYQSWGMPKDAARYRASAAR